MIVCRSRRLVLAAGAALLLAACGGGDEAPAGDDLDAAVADDEAVGDPDDEGADATTTDDADDAGDDATDAEDPAAEGPDDTADEDSGDGGLAEHRPPAEAQALLDCEAVTDASVGANIVFPSDQGDGWLDAGPGPVTVEVVGCSDTFEANLQYEAYHGQNSTPTLDGFTQGGTLGTWGEFSFEETYWTPGNWTVIVFDIDAESGDRIEFDEVTFSVD